MKPSPDASSSAPAKAKKKAKGFTLVELMTAAAVAGLVLAAVASILITSLRLVKKNQQIDSAVTNTRTVQEHINGEMAIAISQTSPVMIRPTFSSGSGTTPARYAVMVYRVPIGSYGTVYSDTPNTSTTITINCPADVVPKAGDYFLMDSPNLGSGIRISSVSGSGPYNLQLSSTILAGIVAGETPVDALANKLVRIQRERKYETVAPSSGSTVTELHWYESTIDSTYTTLSTNVDANARYLFAQVPVDPSPTSPALESSVSWQFSYVASGSNAYTMGGDKSFYQSNFAEGLIMPKSGNPLSASSILGGGSTSLGTTTTTTSTTTSLASTTTMGTSTTKISTTTLGTSTTLKSTTTAGTSTTKLSSTTLLSSTTTAGTSTTKLSTTLQSTTLRSSTTLLSTTTHKSSTTLVSSTTLRSTTTFKSSTTLVSSTTTAGTSTTKQSTTTSGTSTTKLSSTTTAGTSTSKLSTSTAGTSTTKLSTTTAGTSTTKLTTTTTIPFDG